MSPLKQSMGMFLVSPRLKRMKAIMSDMDGAREAFQMLACLLALTSAPLKMDGMLGREALFSLYSCCLTNHGV
jgi:hypothetical protein